VGGGVLVHWVVFFLYEAPEVLRHAIISTDGFKSHQIQGGHKWVKKVVTYIKKGYLRCYQDG
jgi:hypothetical protein